MTDDPGYRYAFPAMRVFVFGQEVTQDVLSVRTVWADGRAPSTCEITLANQGNLEEDSSGIAIHDDRYIITEADIQALYRSVDVREVELPAFKLYADGPSVATGGFGSSALSLLTSTIGSAGSVVTPDARAVRAATNDVSEWIDQKIRERLEREILDPLKRRVLNKKAPERQSVTQPDFTQTGRVAITSGSQLAALRGEAFRYSFQVGDCIFQSNDPVRVFLRDPFDPNVWYYAFSGFVSDWDDDFDADDKKIVTLRCEDVTRILRYARVTGNPGLFDIKALETAEDAAVLSFYNEVFTDLSLPEVLFTILFGSEDAQTTSRLRITGTDKNKQAFKAPSIPYRRVGAYGETNDSGVLEHGAGAFNFDRSLIFSFGPKPRQGGTYEASLPVALAQKTFELQDLSVYQAIVDHQVSVTDLETMALPITRGGRPITRLEASSVVDFRTGAPEIENVIEAIGRHPELYPVDGGRFILLLPASLGATNRDVLTKDLVKGIELKTTFRNRLAMAYDITERLEFSFYATPKGDVLCEMPLYDFEPEDFGTEPVTRAQVEGALNRLSFETVTGTSIGIDAGETRGPFDRHYRIGRQDTVRHKRGFSDERVRTQFACTWNNIRGLTSTGNAQSIGIPPEVRTLRSLVPQFGVRLEIAEPTMAIASPEAAAVYNDLKLNQWNADARSAQIDAMPNLRLGPNRPLEFAERSYVATTRSVGHTLEWGEGGNGGTMNMQLGVNYVRGWAGDTRTGSDGTERPLYAPLGGYAARGLNYAIMFGRNVPTQSAPAPSLARQLEAPGRGRPP